MKHFNATRLQAALVTTAMTVSALLPSIAAAESRWQQLDLEASYKEWQMLSAAVPAMYDRCNQALAKWDAAYQASVSDTEPNLSVRQLTMYEVKRLCSYDINRTNSTNPRIILSPEPTTDGLVPDVIFPEPVVIKEQTQGEVERLIVPRKGTSRAVATYSSTPTDAAKHLTRPTSRSVVRDYNRINKARYQQYNR